MRHLVKAAGALLALTVASSCSTTVAQQTPIASSPSAPSETGSAPGTSSAAPQVRNPLDTAKFDQQPCTALTQAQATQIANLISGQQSAGNVAPVCTWTDADHNRVTVGFLPGNGGLATVYKTRDSASGYFEVAPDVAGYPAVFSATSDLRKDGGCQVVVGVRDDEAFTANVGLLQSSPNYSDPCSLAAKTAEAVVTTLKAGA